jgi:hypothetical protein
VPEKQASRFGATTYPLAIVARNEKPDPDDRVKLAFADPSGITHKELNREGPWLLLESKVRTALQRLRMAGVPLREMSPPSLGVKTGLNSAFIGEVLASKNQVATLSLDTGSVEVEERMVRPAIRGRDVGDFRLKTQKVVLWPYDSRGNIWSELPPLAAVYFKRIRSNLRNRADYRDGPWWTLFRTKNVRRKHLVVWPDIARRPTAVVIGRESGRIPLNSCYVCGFDEADRAHCVAAVVNSVWAHCIAYSSGDEARGGYRRVNARLAGGFPIPTKPSQISVLADLSRKAHADQEYDRNGIDDAVAEALRLPVSVQKTLRSITDG